MIAPMSAVRYNRKIESGRKMDHSLHARTPIVILGSCLGCAGAAAVVQLNGNPRFVLMKTVTDLTMGG